MSIFFIIQHSYSMKQFEVKLYSRDWTFKKVINPKTITSVISFSEEIDWWQSDLNLQVTWDFWDYLCTDIIEVREVDTENKQISRTYSGIIEEIAVVEYKNKDTISLTILWVFTALNDLIYKFWWNRVFTLNMSPWNIVKSVIDSFNTDYWTLSWWDTQNLDWNLIRYTVASIDTSGPTVNIEFDNNTCLDSIKRAIENTWYNFYIWSDWICYVQKESWQQEVSVTMGRQVVSLERKIHKREMVNKLYHERALENEQTYTDPSSIALFWIKEKKEVDAEIQDAATQNIIGAQKIDDYSYERNEISITMKPQKSESIVPWMLLSVNNIKIPLVNKKITKISKDISSWTIYVWDFISFWNSVIKK